MSLENGHALNSGQCGPIGLQPGSVPGAPNPKLKTYTEEYRTSVLEKTLRRLALTRGPTKPLTKCLKYSSFRFHRYRGLVSISNLSNRPIDAHAYQLGTISLPSFNQALSPGRLLIDDVTSAESEKCCMIIRCIGNNT